MPNDFATALEGVLSLDGGHRHIVDGFLCVWFDVNTPDCRPRAKPLFYSWIGLLIVSAVAFHILTAWKVPWVDWEIDRHNIQPDREIAVGVAKHQFNLPENGINVLAGEVVKFTVTSEDLTYGFGVFR